MDKNMRKTFEDLIGQCAYSHDCGSFIEVVTKQECLQLMKQVREATLKEAANNADADFNVISEIPYDEIIPLKDVEVYVLKESILQLDKDSIEI
jgi:hypothetical protein